MAKKTEKPETETVLSEDQENWENSDDKDRRGIRASWFYAERVKKRKVKATKDYSPAKGAEIAAKAEARLKARKVSAPVKDDQERRGFEAYEDVEEEDAG